MDEEHRRPARRRQQVHVYNFIYRRVAITRILNVAAPFTGAKVRRTHKGCGYVGSKSCTATFSSSSSSSVFFSLALAKSPCGRPSTTFNSPVPADVHG